MLGAYPEIHFMYMKISIHLSRTGLGAGDDGMTRSLHAVPMRTSTRFATRFAAVASSVALCFALGACQGADTTGQRSNGFVAPDGALVYGAAVDALRQQGFTTDSSVSSEETGLVVSRHKLSMAPFSGQGYREKATLRIVAVPGHANYYTVEANVLREYNDNIEQPSNPVTADWRTAERVPQLENLLKNMVEMRFVAPDASPEFRQQRGLPQRRGARIEGLETEAPPGARSGPLFPK